MRIAVLRPQVPFARGGAEIFTDELVAELRARGHEADLVSVPFKWYPGARVLTQAFLWRMLDLEEADGRPIDVVVATKFPSYVVRHREKRVWLVHQFRQAYELDGTELGQFGPSAEERALRRQVQELDRRALSEATRLFATSANVVGGLRPLGQPARPRQADRPAPRGGGAARRLRHGDRVRRARSRAARGGGARARARGARERRAARRALCDVLVRVLRAGRRGLRHGAVRGVSLGQAGDHDDRLGRPARRRPRPPDRDRRASRGGRDRGGRGLAARARGRGRGFRPGRQAA